MASYVSVELGYDSGEISYLYDINNYMKTFINIVKEVFNSENLEKFKTKIETILEDKIHKFRNKSVKCQVYDLTEIINNFIIDDNFNVSSSSCLTINKVDNENLVSFTISCSGGGDCRTLKELCSREIINDFFNRCYTYGLCVNIIHS